MNFLGVLNFVGGDKPSRKAKIIKNPTRLLDDPENELRGLLKGEFAAVVREKFGEFEDFKVGLQRRKLGELEAMSFSELPEEAKYRGRTSRKGAMRAMFTLDYTQ